MNPLTRAALVGIASLTIWSGRSSFAQVAPDVKPGVSLTVYSSADPAGFDPQAYARRASADPYYHQQQPMPGYGVVRDIREIDLAAGVSELRFTDVAAGIDPTTVAFHSFTDPAATVLEQSFEYDLVSGAKLLEKYVDKDVVVERSLGDGKTESIKGRLLSAAGGLILRDDAGAVRILNSYTAVTLADAADLITKPTLVWRVSSNQPGKQTIQTSYQTDGITWRADYSLVLSADDSRTDISSWVTLLNQSGATYKDATLKLVAGDVQRVQSQQQGGIGGREMAFAARADEDGGGFQQKSFFEYHLYTLGRSVTVGQNSTKQIELFEARKDVPVEKVYVYYGLPAESRYWIFSSPNLDRNLGTEMNKKVDTYVRFKNEERVGLGIPFPAGRVRVYKRDDAGVKADGNLEFIGEDVVQHTPRDEKILVRLGSAFDLVGERKQTNMTVDEARHGITESFEIKVRNRKETERATVIVKENLFRWTQWEIVDSSAKWTKQDSRTIHFDVDLKPGEERIVTYTVKYTW